MNADDGATKAPESPLLDEDKCIDKESGRTRAHSWAWVWEGAKMTDKVFCRTCGQIRKNIHDKPFRPEGDE